jgi:SAM-dependent methyltransferase
MASVNAPGFWDALYARPRQPWELGTPTPVLVDVIESSCPPLRARSTELARRPRSTDSPGLPGAAVRLPAGGRVAVPGCGRAHDVRYLARKGYAPVGFDFSPAAVNEAACLARKERADVPVVEADVFELGRPELPYRSAFDGVWEYTCYCAIDPARRGEYVDVLAAILRPGGWLLACFFPVGNGAGGPPFPVNLDEVRGLLSPAFRIEHDVEPRRSPPDRQGLERLLLATRR